MDSESNNILENLIQMIKASYDADSIKKFVSENNIDITKNTYPYTEGKSPLRTAVDSGNTEIVKALIEVSQDLNFNYDEDHSGYTSLMLAAEKGYTEIVETLIKAGANVDKQGDYDGKTALMYAAGNGHTEVVKTLVKAKADLYEEDNEEMTALLYAEENNHAEIAKYLTEVATNFELIEHDNYSALRFAAINGNVEIIKGLTEKKIYLKAYYSKGRKALMLAAEKGHAEVVKTLIEEGADLESRGNIGITALMLAAEKGHAEVVKILLEEGAELEMKDDNEMTALMYATSSNNIKALKILVEAGADLDAEDSAEYTALMHSTMNSHNEGIKILLEAGANVDLDKLYSEFPIERFTFFFEVVLDKGDIELLANFLLTEKYDNIALHSREFVSLLNEYNSISESIKSQAMLLYNSPNTKPTAVQILEEEFNKLQVKKLMLIANGTGLKKVTAINGLSELIAEYLGWQKKWGPISQLKEKFQELDEIFFDEEHNYSLSQIDALDEFIFIEVESGNIDSIKKAIKGTLNINLTDSDGDSILHTIVSQGNIDPEYISEIIDLLIKKGIDLEIKNIHGKTALDIAKENLGRGESKFDETVIKLLENYQNNNNIGKKRLITDAEIVTESLDHDQPNKLQKFEEQNQEPSYDEIPTSSIMDITSNKGKGLLCIMSSDDPANLKAFEEFGNSLILIGNDFSKSYGKVLALENQASSSYTVDYTAMAFSAQQGFRFFPTIVHFSKILGVNLPNVDLSPEVKFSIDLALGMVKINGHMNDHSVILGQVLQSGSYFAGLKTTEILNEKPVSQEPTDLSSLFEMCIPEISNGLVAGVSLMSPVYMFYGLISGTAQCLSKHQLFKEETASQTNVRIMSDTLIGIASAYLTPGNIFDKIFSMMSNVVANDITAKVLFSITDIGLNGLSTEYISDDYS